ncbi:uncharacterized protein LOC135199580 [Macrobrachium nipponense]|uniref:uncharacterized protein LOC135199580 n=1 Tax=Macrobrachium nipponense TaxID=159736 RepID=UPI0030C83A54
MSPPPSPPPPNFEIVKESSFRLTVSQVYKGQVAPASCIIVLEAPPSTTSSDMKLIVVACLVAMALAAPRPQHDASIVEDERVDHGDGNFNYNFELSDGTSIEAEGTPNEAGSVNIEGSYRFTLPDVQ